MPDDSRRIDVVPAHPSITVELPNGDVYLLSYAQANSVAFQVEHHSLMCRVEDNVGADIRDDPSVFGASCESYDDCVRAMEAASGSVLDFIDEVASDWDDRLSNCDWKTPDTEYDLYRKAFNHVLFNTIL